MTTWQILGWGGNVCFFARMLLQWLRSEKHGRSVVPRGFWLLSLAGALLVGSYAVHRHNWILTTGFAVTSLLYLRNLWLQGGRRPMPTAVVTLFALAAAAVLVWAGAKKSNENLPRFMTALAAFGQAIWSTRFVLQWWQSERAGQSRLSMLFWWWSLTGNTILLAYALALGDPVFIAGFLLGPLVQIRNLILHLRAGSEVKEPTEPDTAPDTAATSG